jgi:hypothetical protein
VRYARAKDFDITLNAYAYRFLLYGIVWYHGAMRAERHDMDNTITDLLARLSAISPMPDDGNPEQTVPLLQEYEELIRQIGDVVAQGDEPDPALMVPLIHSFGYGSGFGLYWATLHLLEGFPADQLRPALRTALVTAEHGARMWSAFMLGPHRDHRDVPALVTALNDPAEEVRLNALMALAMIGDVSARPAMAELLEDPSARIRKAARKYVDQLDETG